MSANDEALAYEHKHVHNVYEQIASHFSSTRYKPWPVVERFLRDQQPGSVGLDIGCGNGKGLNVNKDIFIVASDRSQALVQIAKNHQPHASVVADALNLPHPNSAFDFAISIAVIHHLSTNERRIVALKAALSVLCPHTPARSGGRLLTFVWALEQSNSRRAFTSASPQDVMVPWVTKKPASSTPETYDRYYHLYAAGELERDIVAAGGRILESGYDRDNWWAIATRNDG
ncbi:MAG: hypothetical protein Q9227_004674 [Pyrenula ochraceoflavens]